MVDAAQISELFQRWNELRAQGQSIPPEQLCSDRPELLPSLQAQIDAVLRMEQFLQSDKGVSAETMTRDETRPPSASTDPSLAAAPRVFAGYHIERLLGRGGMGIVYQARHPQLGLTVALKMMLGETEPGESAERFLREARAVARLNHPHIVRLFEAGAADGTHYFTMALLPGGSLKDLRTDLKADSRRAVALLAKVVRGVQHAHEHGIIHRDLKPGNVLLDERGEPLVSDFGLAKFLDASEDLTATGHLLGTVPYMSPEQVGGHTKATGPAADIWALGVMLYEVLVGQRPFLAESTVELLRQIQQTDPPRPRQLNPALDPVLETMVLKCLEKTPSERYPSAAALADDLEHWLRHEPISLRTPSWPLRLSRRVRRGWRWVGAALLVLVAAVLGVWWFQGRDEGDAGPKEKQQPPGGVDRIDLVDAVGKVQKSRWVLGGDSGKLTENKNGACFMTCENWGLLELMSQPPGTGYRFEGQVAQHDGGSLGGAGLYFCYNETPMGSGKHYFATFNFAENSKPTSQVRLELLSFWDIAKTGVPNQRRSVVEGPLPIWKDPGRFRHLMIEIRPPAVRVTIDNVLVGGTTVKALTAQNADLVPPKQEGQPIPVPPTFAAEQGLGLYVFRCSASFRAVTVRKLQT
jgi:hypothetical protein